MGKNLTNTMVLWNAGGDGATLCVKGARVPEGYRYSDGACVEHVRGGDWAYRKWYVLSMFRALVLEYGFDPRDAALVLSGLEEWDNEEEPTEDDDGE